MWGPIIYGPGPLAHGESKGPSRKRLWPGDAAEDSLVLGRPKAPLRRRVKKRYRNKFVRSKIFWENYPYYPSQIRLCT